MGEVIRRLLFDAALKLLRHLVKYADNALQDIDVDDIEKKFKGD